MWHRKFPNQFLSHLRESFYINNTNLIDSFPPFFPFFLFFVLSIYLFIYLFLIRGWSWPIREHLLPVRVLKYNTDYTKFIIFPTSIDWVYSTVAEVTPGCAIYVVNIITAAVYHFDGNWFVAAIWMPVEKNCPGNLTISLCGMRTT